MVAPLSLVPGWHELKKACGSTACIERFWRATTLTLYYHHKRGPGGIGPAYIIGEPHPSSHVDAICALIVPCGCEYPLSVSEGCTGLPDVKSGVLYSHALIVLRQSRTRMGNEHHPKQKKKK